MLMSLREARSKFKKEHLSLKIGLGKFCELRPTLVKLFNQIPHQVCVCTCSYHENVRLLLVALKDHTNLCRLRFDLKGVHEWKMFRVQRCDRLVCS